MQSSLSGSPPPLVKETKIWLNIGRYKLMDKNHIIPTQQYSPIDGTNPTPNNFFNTYFGCAQPMSENMVKTCWWSDIKRNMNNAPNESCYRRIKE
jgi:hypothetical protein